VTQEGGSKVVIISQFEKKTETNYKSRNCFIMQFTVILSFVFLFVSTLPAGYAQGLNNPNVPPVIVKTDTPQQCINAARNEILAIIDGLPALAPKFVRLSFHDCVGGCDGCVDLLNPDNFGLKTPISALETVAKIYAKHNVTRADIWALAAMTAIDHLQGTQTGRIDYSFNWYGRPTCDMINRVCRNAKQQEVPCSATRGPDRLLPSADLDNQGILNYFETTFGLDAEETTILLGVHSIGRVQRTNSGFVGRGWDTTPMLLDNHWYKQLVGPLGEVGPNAAPDAQVKYWVQRAPAWRPRMIDNRDITGTIPGIPNRNQWSGGENTTTNESFMLNSDIAFVRDFAGFIDKNGRVSCSFKGPKACPAALKTIGFMSEYRENNTLWLEDFSVVYTFMLEFPFPTKKDGACQPGQLCFIGDLQSFLTPSPAAAGIAPAESPFQSPVGAPSSSVEVPVPAKLPPLPTASAATTRVPTGAPSRRVTTEPTKVPTGTPSRRVTTEPTKVPTGAPSRRVTKEPTKVPTVHPTSYPTKVPTVHPTLHPTKVPTKIPTKFPTKKPVSLLKQLLGF
jgi:Peroxidase/PT repeat